MHWKKYAILIPPFLLIGVLLITYLPPDQKHYVMLFSLLFWVAYYTWIAIEEKKEERLKEKKERYCVFEDGEELYYEYEYEFDSYEDAEDFLNKYCD